MCALEFRVLGPLEVLRDGALVELGAAKQRALLAILLTHANEVVPVDRLIDDLWGERPPDRAANALQVYVSGLRKVLGRDRLVTRRPGYGLEVGVEELDALQFERWAEQGRAALERGDPAAALHHLAGALSLWRGPALADFAYEPFATADAARLEELRISAIEDRIDADLALGRHREVIGTLDGLVTEHPLRERLSGQRMLALYRSGRQAESLRAYQALRKLLAQELGIDPSPALQQLEAAILAQDPALDAVAVDSGALTDRASRATAARPLPAAFQRRDRLPFVGREHEWERLAASWTEATRGSVQLVWLSGEPGVEKTRLAIEFGASVAEEGAIVLHGRCEEDIGVPYQPIVEAVGQYVESAPDEVLRAHVTDHGSILGRLVPELERRVGRTPERVESDPAVDRRRLFDATASLVAAASRQAPVFVLLDDLHWADKPTLLLLRHLVRWHGPAAVLVVASYRDTDVDDAHPLRSVAAEVSREPGTERLALSGLDSDNVADLVEAAAGQNLTDQQSAVAYVLAHETDGNPFFVREILRHLVETGRITGGADGWTTDLTVEQLGIPQAVKDVIGLRLGRLSKNAQTALTMAAVIGRAFDTALLTRLLDASDDDLVTAIEEAEAARLIVETGDEPGTYTFAHALIRETLYASISRARRGHLHGRVAAAIEEGTSGDASVGELAYHYTHAIQPDLRRAIEYSRRAGEFALGKLAYEDAAAQFERAVAAADAAHADALLRFDLLLCLGDAQWKAGEEASSRATFRSAADLARQVGDDQRLAMAAVGAVGLGFEGAEMYDNPVPLLEEALAALGPQQSVLRARVLAAYARANLFIGDANATRAAGEEALAIARRMGDRRTLVEVLAAWFWVGWGDDADHAADAADELLSLTESLPDLHYRAEARICHLLSRLQLGRRDEALADVDALRALSSETAHDRYRWYSLSWDATIAAMEGRFADAKQLAQDAVTIGFPLRGPAAAFAYVTHLSLVFWAEGALADVAASVDSAPELEGSPLQDTVLTFLLAESGRREEAAAALEDAVSDGFDRYSGMTRVPALAFLANASATLGIPDHAEELYERLLHDEGSHVVIPRWLSGGVVTGPVPYFLGRLRHLHGDPAGAIPHYERALVMDGELHSWASQARVQLDYASALLDLPEPDPEKAAAALSAGRAIIERVGMPQVVPYLESLEQQVRGHPGAAVP